MALKSFSGLHNGIPEESWKALSIKGLKNETASKTVINFHVMVTEAIFSLNNSGGVTIQIHFLQNESQVSPLAPQWERARQGVY